MGWGVPVQVGRVFPQAHGTFYNTGFAFSLHVRSTIYVLHVAMNMQVPHAWCNTHPPDSLSTYMAPGAAKAAMLKGPSLFRASPVPTRVMLLHVG